MRKIWICVLALCLALCASACAESALFKGAGTEESPYQIATVEELHQLAEVMKNDDIYRDYDRAYYQLTADIALNDVSGFDAWDSNPPANVWTPIGDYHSFCGVFDGNGHTISGLFINQAVAKDEYDREVYRFGLFGGTDGEIRNLTITNAFINPVKGEGMAYSPEGGILAGSNGGLIENCAIEGVVICSASNNGGIVASNFGQITGCTFTGKMIERNGENYYNGGDIGGIAGSGGNISDCTVNAQILCEKNAKDDMCGSIGGIAGIHSSFDREECIENCTFNGEIVGGSNAGGIVGHAGIIGKVEGAACIVRNCVNNGTVKSAEDAGGIVGLAMHTGACGEILVENCVNRGVVGTMETGIYAAAGIVGCVDTRSTGTVVATGCVNEADFAAYLPGGIVGRVMQMKGHVRVTDCVNKGALTGEGTYAGGILCHIQQWGEEWSVEISGCTNEGSITAEQNVGGIVCFAHDLGNKDTSLSITDCVNRGNLTSAGGNNFMGGILGVNSMAKTPVTISGCTNEGNLEYTREVLVDKETLSGNLFTLSRTSGGIVGYVGFAPYLSVNSGEREQKNIGVKKAWMNIENCASTGSFIHKEAKFADDVDDALLDAWKQSGYDKLLNFFIPLEGGIVGTVADNKDYSVNITNCTFENIEREIDDWNRFK